MAPSCCLVSREIPNLKRLGLENKFDQYLIGAGNKWVYGRFEAILSSSRKVIYTQDDDCIVPVDALWAQFDGRFTNNMLESRLPDYADGITLIGWGAFFLRDLVQPAFDFYLGHYPKDDFFYRLSDRIFTGLTADKKTVCLPFQHLPNATAPDRMYQNPGHWDDLAEVRMRLKMLTAQNIVVHSS